MKYIKKPEKVKPFDAMQLTDFSKETIYKILSFARKLYMFNNEHDFEEYCIKSKNDGYLYFEDFGIKYNMRLGNYIFRNEIRCFVLTKNEFESEYMLYTE